MTTEVLKEYLGMIADLERDLYEYLKIEASIDKKLRESYVLPVERSFEEYCKNHFYDTTLAAFPSEKAPTEPSKPRGLSGQGFSYIARFDFPYYYCRNNFSSVRIYYSTHGKS